MKKITLFLVTLLGVYTVSAQSINDALVYSQNTTFGTARSTGIAGAFTALGADFGGISINPAGLGLYRKSEFILSPSLSFAKDKADYVGTSITDKRSSFNFNNIGLVFSSGERNKQNRKKEVSPKDWRAVNFAFGFNRLSNYNTRQSISGYNTETSISDYLAEQANLANVSANDLLTNIESEYAEASLAFNTYIINPLDVTANTYQGIATATEVDQTQTRVSNGGKNEYLFALGANYKDRLYLGASFNFDTYRRKTETSFIEKDPNEVTLLSLNYGNGNASDILGFKSLNINRTISETGVGVNGKFGATYRINQIFRAGLAIHTPTVVQIDRDYSTIMGSDFVVIANNNGLNYDFSESYFYDGNYDYRINTPWQLSTGAAVFLKNFGFISLDYNFVDYSQMTFSFDSGIEDATLANSLNQSIRDTYTAASNVRLGTEFSRDIFRLRAGYAFTGSPYRNAPELSSHTLTGGFGIREKKVYFDAAYAHKMQKDTYSPYSLTVTEAPKANLKQSRGNVVLTVGVNF